LASFFFFRCFGFFEKLGKPTDSPSEKSSKKNVDLKEEELTRNRHLREKS
jgi:hypothetical protein